MTERTPLSQYYREGRERLTALVRDHLDDAATAVPATPGWTVHDVIAHLVGVSQDIVSGTVPKQGPTPAWTSGHVQRGAGLSTEDLLESWLTQSADTERVVDTYTIWPAVMDVVCHEHDVRGALGDAGGRDNEFVAVAAKLVLGSMNPSRPLVIETESKQFRVGPEEGEPITLRTTSWEAFRWRFGRRSRAQLAAMDWSGDAAPILDELCIFGPAAADVIE